MRRLLALVWVLAASGPAGADQPGIPPWIAPAPAHCGDFNHPDRVADAIRGVGSCRAATALYYRCEARWINSPEMEDAATTACQNDTRALTARQAERYETLQQACEERYQGRDGVILWSAVRNCKVRLAERWAKRYPARR